MTKINLISLNLALLTLSLPGLVLATDIDLNPGVPEGVTATSTCTTTFSGYIYNEKTKTCDLNTVISCENIFSFQTKQECEDVNLKDTQKEPVFNTIQDRAKATRESFLMRGKDLAPETNEQTDTENTNRLKTIEEKIANLREQAVILSFTRVINRVQNYNNNLNQIISRLNNKLDELKLENKNIDGLKEKLTLANTLSNNASSTLNQVLASTTVAFSTSNPSQTLTDVKNTIATTTKNLQEAKSLVEEVIETIKTLI